MEVSRGVHVDELRELFYIDDDWKLRWLVSIGPRAKVGAVAGSRSGYDYERVGIKKKMFLAHRVTWALHYGEWPNGSIDHINGVRDDNRIENLREVTHQENLRNQKLFITNKTRLAGVSWSKATDKWESYIYDNYRKKHLGIHEDFFEAVCVRKSAEFRLGFHANHGRS